MAKKLKTTKRMKRMRGRGAAMDWFKKAGEWLVRNVKEPKLVSRISGALASVGVPYAAQVNRVSGALGWGKRRSGRGLRLAGGYRRY